MDMLKRVKVEEREMKTKILIDGLTLIQLCRNVDCFADNPRGIVCFLCVVVSSPPTMLFVDKRLCMSCALCAPTLIFFLYPFF